MVWSYTVLLLVLLVRSIYCCLINPCNYQYCKNEANCSLNENCMPDCECPYGFSGSRCDIEIPVSDFNCSHCQENEVCFSSNGSWICQTTTSSPTTTIGTESTTNLNRNTSQDACSPSYVSRTTSERRCFGSYCVYGKCNKTLEDINGIQTPIERCECDPGAAGTKCEFQCCRDCGHGFCQYSISDQEEFCNCEPGYTGESCQELRPVEEAPLSDPDWVWWLVGGCTLALLVLLFLLVVVPYCLWKKRVLVVMKVAYFFQPYEDNDDKVWDAFVSYKSDGADEDFVLHKLQPVLEEQLGFRLCLHYRDFVIGAAIFENIIEAINNSRRTILVLSPRFLSSEWTRYEYQVALQEMLKKKHRIIPVILEDISEMEDVDETLKQILSSITYIKWPESEKKQKHFWKTLQFSLPKKRAECGGSSANTELSSTETTPSEDFKSISHPPSDKLTNTQLTKTTSDLRDVKINFPNESRLFKNIAFVSNLKIEDSGNLKALKDEVYHF